ncbi:hypothetical protein HK104_006313 [Borealophlyctis nickersoniae]|nr:hypothetical protein HK104_006313 [Borealophlyctis nickersoniae]
MYLPAASAGAERGKGGKGVKKGAGDGGGRAKTMYPCGECGHRFTRRFNLKEHMQIHAPHRQRDYKCTDCGRAYFRSSDLDRHRKAHLATSRSRHRDAVGVKCELTTSGTVVVPLSPPLPSVDAKTHQTARTARPPTPPSDTPSSTPSSSRNTRTSPPHKKRDNRVPYTKKKQGKQK